MALFFSAESLATKLQKLQDSQESVTVLSQYLIHHRKHAPVTVDTWFEELGKVSSIRRLAFLHLANDVLQNSKKKGDEYCKAFEKCITAAVELCCKKAPNEVISKIQRLVGIWEERKIFPESIIQQLKTKVPKKEPILKKNESILKRPLVLKPSSNPIYEPNPIVNHIQSMKVLEKKRLLQGGDLAASIDPNLTNAIYIRESVQNGSGVDTLAKVNAALDMTNKYCKLMDDEGKQRDLLISELQKELKTQQDQQQQLDVFKNHIETIEKELKLSKNHLES